MNRLPIIGLSVLILGLRPALAEPAPDEAGPAQVITILRADIAAKPSRVLIAVEDALTMNEQAAGEIVKAAIEATRADAKLVGEIVFTALKNAPGMAATIVECALGTSPDAAEQIKDAMQRALGSKASIRAVAGAGQAEVPGEKVPPAQATGKEPAGKGGVATAPDEPGIEDSFDLSWVGVGGIYLFTPARGFLHVSDPHEPCGSDDLSRACLRP
jgi:hypothetical protein